MKYDYKELKKHGRYKTLMKWKKSDLACHSIKYQSLCGEYKCAHDEMVARNALLRNRYDLPVDRIPAHQELVRLQEAIREKNRYIDMLVNHHIYKDVMVENEKLKKEISDLRGRPYA